MASRRFPLLLPRLASRAALVGAVLLSPLAVAETITFKDPKGDDNGPGTYVYPSNAAYKPGSFDLTDVTIETSGAEITVSATLAAPIEDPWGSKGWEGNGFSVQMLFVFIDTDGKAGSGHKDGTPGLNVKFAEDSRWEKCLLISPQGSRRLQTEIDSKAKAMAKDLIIPKRVRVQGRKLVATYDAAAIGTPAKGWGYQVVVQSNEGFPSKNDLLTRPVNEIKGEHRFGGGHDFNCDPHVIDMLAGGATGDGGEKEAQHKALKAYTCNDDDENGGKQTEIGMVRR